MPAVARIGDLDLVHCSVPVRGQGSPNVFVNGVAWSRVGDKNVVHLLPGSPCPSHDAAISSGSATVKINGKSAGRIGDPIAGCTAVAQGSPNVFAGG
jgi:uncharacterized Zn-binding protein involved in type VI secretion